MIARYYARRHKLGKTKYIEAVKYMTLLLTVLKCDDLYDLFTRYEFFLDYDRIIDMMNETRDLQ